jgi:hypothetical protein
LPALRFSPLTQDEDLGANPPAHMSRKPHGERIASAEHPKAHAGVSRKSASALQRFVQFGDRLLKLIVVHDILAWNAADRRGQVAQNVGEQAKVEMHVN